MLKVLDKKLVIDGGDFEQFQTNITNIELVRIETNYDGLHTYIFKYIDTNNKIIHFYTTLEKNRFIQPFLLDYYNHLADSDKFIDIKFSSQRGSMDIQVFINTDFISMNKDNIAFKTLCNMSILKLQKLPHEIGIILTNNSFCPTEPQTLTNNNFKKFGIKLFDYQLKSIQRMSAIENGTIIRKIPRTFNLSFNDINVLWDPFYNRVVDEVKYCEISSQGGILADSMGLGKTLTMIGLTYYNNTSLNTLPIDNTIIHTNATLVIVPSHLSKQWINEYIKVMPKTMKIISILTKSHHTKITYADFKTADMIIVSQQFLLNFKNYIMINYMHVTPTSYNMEHRLKFLKNVFLEWIETNKNIDMMTQPLFEYFHFKRVIVDEGHEIFEEILSNNTLNKWLLGFLDNIKSNYKWYVSGTPFNEGFVKCMKYINLKLKFDEETIKINYIKSNGCILSHSDNIYKYISKTSNFIITNEFLTRLMDQVIIRHRKEDVENIIKIPGFTETIEWVDLTTNEQSIYDSKKTIASRLTLQQICCHPMIVDSMKKMLGNNNDILDLDQVQEHIKKFNNTQIERYTDKISKLDSSKPEYHMLLSTYNSKISESKFMLNILEKINTSIDIEKYEDVCIICYDIITKETDSILTSCGHLYCEKCILTALKYKSECPTCKSAIKSKLYKINHKLDKPIEIIKKNNDNPLINKYGAKLGKLIQMIKHLIISSQTNRIIVFSQWDDMLNLIGKCLSDNDISNSFIKGNVHCRNKAIERFKQNSMTDDSRVIMLSLKNSASGTNLTEATHIFFVEPIDTNNDKRLTIEGQAIGRACRIGQKKEINLIRILCKNTIEEEIYNKSLQNTLII
jgi:SNF2 family DNA or RNA helicase